MSASDNLHLGEVTGYTDMYTPSLLCSLPRAQSRRAWLGEGELPFFGQDVWNGYELSWLNEKGKPQTAALRIHAPCRSAAIVESKSLKLYLNSFAQTCFANRAEVLSTLDKDLTLAFRAPVVVELLTLAQTTPVVDRLPGVALDDLDVRVTQYETDRSLLRLAEGGVTVRETMHTHLFRSLCPVTGQPDWASILIRYQGPAIDRQALLLYLLSYRTHAGFHEAVVEQIFVDLLRLAEPMHLSVFGMFQRRGGLDINPFRTTDADESAPLLRTVRQ